MRADIAFPLFLGLRVHLPAHLFELFLVNVVLVQTVGGDQFVFYHFEYFGPDLVETCFVVLHIALLEHSCNWKVTCTL